jgi:outer membrane immunogenic protein
MKTLFLGLLMAAAATSAFAADLPTRKGYPVAPQPMYAPPAFTWGGLYVGINGGYAYGNVGDTNFANPNGGAIGATLGYNMQMGQIVFGVEGDFDYAFTKKGNNFAFPANNGFPAGVGSNTYSINWITTERLRLGYAMDRALFYVTGGYAGMSTRASVNDSLGNNFSQNEWRHGAAVGGGIEYAFSNNITAKAEYLWLPMEDKTYWTGGPYQETNKLDASLFRVGVNYKF